MMVGFTGTRTGMSANQKRELGVSLRRIAAQSESFFHHGDCVGSDAEAHSIALQHGLKVIIHPPLNASNRAFCKGATEVLEPKEYLSRNRDIVNAIELLIAAPKEEVEILRSGTWSTLRYARKTGKQTIVLAVTPPSGEVGK